MAKALAVFFVVLVGACSKPTPDEVWTLYRNSMVDESMRIHWATFDANEGDGYNRANCFEAARVIMEVPGVTTRYWCEMGRFELTR